MSASSALGSERRARLAAARLYLVCDSAPGGRSLLEILAAAVAGGVEIVQLRDKLLGDDELAEVAREAGALCRQLGALLIVNDRPAVALEAGADGVHVGQEDMSVARARELVGADMLIGLSTHAPAEIDAVAREQSTHTPAAESDAVARAESTPGAGCSCAAGDNPRGVDYIGVGPVHSTPTKPGRPAVGLSLVRHATAHARVPFFAIGGIHRGNAASVIEAGAQRLAVVRAIADAADPESAARELRTLLAGAHERSCARNRPA
jgi:thiamine-phosphate pyrophosphorylase